MDINEDRLGPHTGNRSGCGHERERCGDDLIAAPDFQRQECKDQCIRPRGAADGVAACGQGSDFTFECVDLRPKNEVLAFEHIGHRI